MGLLRLLRRQPLLRRATNINILTLLPPLPWLVRQRKRFHPMQNRRRRRRHLVVVGAVEAPVVALVVVAVGVPLVVKGEGVGVAVAVAVVDVVVLRTREPQGRRMKAKSHVTSQMATSWWERWRPRQQQQAHQATPWRQ
jgi:hypothetical protein